VFEITPGKLAYIGRINLRGDSPRLNTLGKTIRRAMKVAAGDRFNAMTIDAARHRIETLGFVRNAVISTRRGGSDRLIDVDVEIDLED
jgi:outer membrane protein assembly factor BamA